MKKRMFRAIFGLLLALVLVSAMSLSAFAGDGDEPSDTSAPVSYGDGQETVDTYTLIEADTIAWSTGWYVASDSVAITDRVTVTGNVNLILCDNAILTVSKGITVEGNNSLTIWGQAGDSGKLFAGTSGTDASCTGTYAGIGSASKRAGVITINGGIIKARGGNDRGAGIGGNQSHSCTEITINGGTVTAIGAKFAAGIGNGPDNDNSDGKITINGGTIIATGGENGAGIGGGTNGKSCEVEINNGEVTANGGSKGAGIGGGSGGTSCQIVINNGTVTAAGGYGSAGVGGGYLGDAGIVTINNGVVNANGASFGAGIGGGGVSKNGTVTISGGKINAASENYGAGIGSGGDAGKFGDITITGGTITAICKNRDGAGIGTGGRGACGTITISGDDTVIKAVGGVHASGIGSGFQRKKQADFSIIIEGGSINATAGDCGAGIGSGGFEIEHPQSDRIPGSCSITISGGTITAAGGGDSPYHFGVGAGIGAGGSSSCNAFTITGGTVVGTGATGLRVDSPNEINIGEKICIFYGDSEASAEMHSSDELKAVNTDIQYYRFTDLHTHKFEYSVSGASITAKCVGNNVKKCSIKEGLTITLSAPAASALIYDGTVKKASMNADYDKTAFPGNYTIKYYQGNTEIAAEEVKNAGDYTAKVTVGSGENAVTASVDFTIAPKPVTITANSGNETYDGTEKTVSGFVCSVDGLSFTDVEALGNGTNAGTYDVTFTGVTLNETKDSTGNYIVTEVETSKLVINPATVTLTANSGNETYDGTEKTVSGFICSVDGLEFSGVTAACSGTNAGTYDVTFTGLALNETKDSTGNYIVTEGETGKLVINPAMVTLTANSGNETYDGTEKTVSGFVCSVDGLSFTDVEALGSGTNAGTYDITFTGVTLNETKDSTGNYIVTETVEGQLTVAPAPALNAEDLTDAEKPSAKEDLRDNGSNQELVNAPENLPEGYTGVQYSVDGGSTWSEEVPSGAVAGDYIVKVKYVADGNHTDFLGEDISVRIKAVYSVTFNSNGGTEVQPQSVDEGDKATKPEDPERNGYKLDGWYLDSMLTEVYDFSTPVTADITVFAKWTSIGYSVISVTGLSGDNNNEWLKDSNTNVEITVKPLEGEDHSFSIFAGVEIDGEAITLNKDYEAREGSTIVSISAAALQVLENGEHTITVKFENGEAEVRMIVKAVQPVDVDEPVPQSPKTGDGSTNLWISIFVLGIISLGGVLVVGKKRREAMR